MSAKRAKFEEQPSRPFIVIRTKRGGFKASDIMVIEKSDDESKAYVKIKGGKCQWVSSGQICHNRRPGSAWRECHTCGKVFEVTIEERQWFEDKGFSLPTHCKICIDKKKEAGYYKDRKDNIEAQKEVLHDPFRVRPAANRKINP